jgi:hypothetical protein
MKTVILNDDNFPYNVANDRFLDAAKWAKRHCKSFVRYTITDVSDISLTNDILAEYFFKDEKDAIIFMLRWT